MFRYFQSLIDVAKIGSVALALTLPSVSLAAEPPNVVLFLIDDLGWKDLGCYDADYYETPHIDALAASGVRFTNGYAASAVCSPTRASVVTGKYPSRIGITDWIRARFQGGKGGLDTPFDQGYGAAGKDGLLCPKNPFFLPKEHFTIAEALKSKGYKTCYIGKWHLGYDPYYPEHQGYDFNYGGCDYGQPPSYFDPYTNPKLKQGIYNLPGRKKGEYLTDREADEAISFIEEFGREQPFFLQMSTYTVHTPIQSKNDQTARFPRKKNAKYAGMVASLDDAVGKVLQKLEEIDVSKRTIVIFTSDNGGLDSNGSPTECAPLRQGKGHPYEGGIRVPLIIRWPGVTTPGATTETPAISPDLFPTICSAADVDLPADHITDGVDLRPLLAGGDLLERSLLWHFPHYRGGILPYSIIRDGKWKLLKRYAGDKEFELYDLENDLSEARDLSASMPEKVEELNKKLSQLLEETGSRLPKLAK